MHAPLPNVADGSIRPPPTASGEVTSIALLIALHIRKRLLPSEPPQLLGHTFRKMPKWCVPHAIPQIPKKAANFTSPSEAGGGRSERSKLREGVRPGFRTEETAAVLMPPPECR